MDPVVIGGKKIGNDQPCFIIGEIGLNHNGDINIAKQLIDVSLEAGVDCVKFQKRDVANLAVSSVLDAEDKRFPEFGKTYREIREHLEFDKSQYVELIDYTKKKGLIFLCTAFDVASVEFLEELKIDAYKVASHGVTNLSVHQKLASIRKPVVLSTGMCTLEELDRTVKILKEGDVPLVLLHCVSSYPQAFEESNIKMIDVLKERYRVPVGYSGHEMGHLPTILSVARGAVAVERHITLDTKMNGFDHKLSLDPFMLKQMVNEIRQVEQIIGLGDKIVSEREQVTRDKYHVSMVSICEIKKGNIIEEKMITFKNPGTGLAPSRLKEIIGKKASKDIPKDILLTLDMVG